MGHQKLEFDTTKWFRNQYIKEAGLDRTSETGLVTDFNSVSPALIYKIFDYLKSGKAPSAASQFYWDLKKYFEGNP